MPTTIQAYGMPGVGGTPTTFSSNSRLAFVKRTNEDVALNMGYIFGAGQRGIKKRVREYFTDCNDLITKVNKIKIKKKLTL